jgi:hypothetical protein
MQREPIDMDAFAQAFDAMFEGKWTKTIRPRIAEVNDLNDQLAEGASGVILRQCQRLEEQIAGYRKLADMRMYSRDRQLIGDLFQLLTDQCEALQKIALMVTPRRERG